MWFRALRIGHGGSRQRAAARNRHWELDVGPGVTLVVIGAIFAFAIRKELPGIDIQVVGLILMVAGAAVIAHARYGRVREQKVRRVEAPQEPGAPTHSVVTEKTEREIL
jgi:hypothetical protein